MRPRQSCGGCRWCTRTQQSRRLPRACPAVQAPDLALQDSSPQSSSSVRASQTSRPEAAVKAVLEVSLEEQKRPWSGGEGNSASSVDRCQVLAQHIEDGTGSSDAFQPQTLNSRDRSAAASTSSAGSSHQGPRRRRWRGRFVNSASAGFLAALDACDGGDSLEVIDDLLESQAARIHQIAAVNAFNERVATRRFDAALRLIQVLDAANRHDVLRKLSHAQFLRGAQQQALQGRRHTAVKQALQFLRLVPEAAADAKSCTIAASVCSAAKDAAAAMDIARLHRLRCRTFDEPLYGSLIYTCASAGKVEEAAQLYGEFATHPGAHRQGQSAHAAMIAACSEASQALSSKDRRGRLVLLQRAMRVADDIRAAGREPSLEVLHALAVAAGHAGQVQQALQICREMQAKGSVDVRMFTILVHAAATAGKRELALASYQRGLDSGAAVSVCLYTAAIGACATPEQPADVEAALGIYDDLQRADVKADCWLFAVMIRVAGRAGRLDIALQMQKDMAAVGIPPSRETQSALLSACVANEALDEALALLTTSQQSLQHMPLLPAFNALLAALARCSRLGDIITAIQAMQQARLRPDCFSFAAVLSACQRLQAYDLGAAVYGLLRRRGIPVDEAICFVVLRLCFNAQRATWSPGGYPPFSPSAEDSWGKISTSTAASLLAALDPSTPLAVHAAALADPRTGLPLEHADQDEQGQWASMALRAYRDALAAGCKPRLHVLERVLACLRLPLVEEPQLRHAAPFHLPSSGSATKGLGLARLPAGQQEHDQEQEQELQWPFDSRALAVVEGAIAQGVLPPPGQSGLDLRAMPPNLAQAYLLTHLAVMQRSFAIHGRSKASEVLVLVPPFDTMEVWRPSHQSTTRDEGFTGFSDADETDALAHELWNEYGRRGLLSSQEYASSSLDAVSDDALAHVPTLYDQDATAFVASMADDSHMHGHGLPMDNGGTTAPGGWAIKDHPADDSATSQTAAPGGGADFPGHCPLDERTGLGVAGLLRRIGLHGGINARTGRILVKDSEVERWLQHAFGSNSSPAIYSPMHYSSTMGGARREMQHSISEQQRRIRLGL